VGFWAKPIAAKNSSANVDVRSRVIFMTLIFDEKFDGAKMGVGGKVSERFPMNCEKGGMNCR
jgi:hypothetical protein